MRTAIFTIDTESYEAKKKSALAKAYITYDFGDRKEVVNAPLIADWIVTRADGEYVIDEVAVTDYVESWLQNTIRSA